MDISTTELLFLTYMINQVDTIRSSLGIYLTVALIGGMLFLPALCLEGVRLKKIYVIPFALSILLSSITLALLPTKDALINIAGVYGISELARTETAKAVGNSVIEVTTKATAVINKKLDEELAK